MTAYVMEYNLLGVLGNIDQWTEYIKERTRVQNRLTLGHATTCEGPFGPVHNLRRTKEKSLGTCVRGILVPNTI